MVHRWEGDLLMASTAGRVSILYKENLCLSFLIQMMECNSAGYDSLHYNTSWALFTQPILKRFLILQFFFLFLLSFSI